MSEYQYYEFLAMDRRLSDDHMDWLRGLSTRAQISPTSFTNVYHWGDFRGDPVKMMERCFDAFVYVTNWGYRRFMLRLPREEFDDALAKPYCHEGGLSVQKKKDCVLVEFDLEEEPDGYDWDDGTGWMASLSPLRGDLLEGDPRCLYLAWLRGVELEVVAEGRREPPVPSGLGELSAPLTALAEFLAVDSELLAVAAERSDPNARNDPRTNAMKTWIASLPAAEKDELLWQIARGEVSHPRRALEQRFRKAHTPRMTTTSDTDSKSRRTVAEITEAWQERVREKERQAAEKAKREKERKARAEAKARNQHIEEVASRGPKAWKEVSALIESRTPKGYDQAVALLRDLGDAAALTNDAAAFEKQLRELREDHGRKPSLMSRLKEAGL